MMCKHTFISQDNANAILYKTALTVFGVLGSKVHVIPFQREPFQ